jgi:hypothetical protein
VNFHVKAEPITNYVIMPHAQFEFSRRGLREDTIRAILLRPEQRFEVRPGRVVLQSRIHHGQAAKQVLVRVFVDIDRTPAEVVTGYRTGKIAKYWKE